MATYATRACHDCDVLLPSNELFLVNQTVKTGESTWTSGEVGHRPSHQGKSSSYRFRTIRLCYECKRARFWAAFWTVIWGLGAAIILIGVFIYVNNADSSSQPVYDEGTSQAVEDVPGPTNLLPDAYAEEPVVEEVEQAIPDKFVQDVSPERAPVIPEPSMSEAIAALSSIVANGGESKMWDGDGRSGWLVPSAVQTGGGQTCRTVDATVIDGQDQKPVSSELWCKWPDGKWNKGRPSQWATGRE